MLLSVALITLKYDTLITKCILILAAGVSVVRCRDWFHISHVSAKGRDIFACTCKNTETQRFLAFYLHNCKNHIDLCLWIALCLGLVIIFISKCTLPAECSDIVMLKIGLRLGKKFVNCTIILPNCITFYQASDFLSQFHHHKRYLASKDSNVKLEELNIKVKGAER